MPTLERLIWGERNRCRLGDKTSSLSVPKELKVCGLVGTVQRPFSCFQAESSPEHFCLACGGRGVCEHWVQFHSSHQLSLCLAPDSWQGTGHQAYQQGLGQQGVGQTQGNSAVGDQGADICPGQHRGGCDHPREGWHCRWCELYTKAQRHRTEEGPSNSEDSGMSPVTRAPLPPTAKLTMPGIALQTHSADLLFTPALGRHR